MNGDFVKQNEKVLSVAYLFVSDIKATIVNTLGLGHLTKTKNCV